MRQKRKPSNFNPFNRYLQSNDDDFDTKSEDISPIRSSSINKTSKPIMESVSKK